MRAGAGRVRVMPRGLLRHNHGYSLARISETVTACMMVVL